MTKRTRKEYRVSIEIIGGETFTVEADNKAEAVGKAIEAAKIEYPNEWDCKLEHIEQL